LNGPGHEGIVHAEFFQCVVTDGVLLPATAISRKLVDMAPFAAASLSKEYKLES